MPDRSIQSSSDSRDRWAAQLAVLDGADNGTRSRKTPITVDRIASTAFALVAKEGFDALTMRRLAAALHTGPASLYGHVRNKADLDDLLIGRLCSEVVLPKPSRTRWRAQIIDVCEQLRDQFLRYPGISRAALAATPSSVDTLRINEGMLAILLAGGVPAQSAAWAIDAAYLYVAAYSLEASLRQASIGGPDERSLNKAEIVERLRMLPADRFPNTVAHAETLAAGDAHERFDFTLRVLFDGLAGTASQDAATRLRRTSR
jgi:AcrR family transcriptional regulator